MNTIKLAQNVQNITPDFRFRDQGNLSPVQFNRRNLLDSSRLARRPSPRPLDASGGDSCAACDRSLLPEKNALDDLNVCADCLRIYAAVDRALNRRADIQSENRKRAILLEKWGKV